MDNAISEFERQKVVIELFIEGAKTYVQLSTLALVLSVTFIEKVLGEHGRIKVDRFLISSWVAFLVAIGAGAAYQYAAVKFLDWKSGFAGTPGLVPVAVLHRPGFLYGTMLVSFYVGAILFTIGAIKRLRQKRVN
jgi:hypothetical protein